MTRLLTTIVALCAPIIALAQTQSSVPNPAQVEGRLRTMGRVVGQPDSAYAIEDRMRFWHVPGVSLAIIDDFKVVFARGYGVTEFGGRTRVDTSTLFQAGSISKAVFATGALKLVEQGVLSLDADVNALLKSWRVPDSDFNRAEKVTLRRLLTHSAGLTVWGFPGYNDSVKTVPSIVDVLDGKGNTAAVRNDTTPGARWLYSGGGYTIAQLLATDVTGEPFPALMRRLVLAPAGMSHSTYENPLPSSYARFAASGHERMDMPVLGRYHTYPEMAAAGLWTTAPDLARWAIQLSRSYDGASGGVLSSATAQQMVFKHVPTGPRGGNGFYGLGVAVAGDGDSISFSHGGRDEGFVANFVMWPRLGKGFVILTNGVSGALLSEIRRAFAETYGVGATPRTERTAIAVDTATLSLLAGRYVRTDRDTLVLDVRRSGGTLSVHHSLAKRTLTMWPLGNDQYYDPHAGGTLVFQREPDGRGKAVRLGLAASAPVATRQ